MCWNTQYRLLQFLLRGKKLLQCYLVYNDLDINGGTNIKNDSNYYKVIQSISD